MSYGELAKPLKVVLLYMYVASQHTQYRIHNQVCRAAENQVEQ